MRWYERWQWGGARAPMVDGGLVAAASGTTALGLLAIEVADAARTAAPGDRVVDAGTSSLFTSAAAVALGTAVVSLVRPGRRSLPRSRRSFWFGTAVTWSGMAINRWARLSLADHYRPVVTVVEDHCVVEHGPYRYVRHPMYTGSVLMCAGLATTLATWPCRLAFLLPPAALARRIDVEERALREALGEKYAAYAAGRPRLMPVPARLRKKATGG